MEVLGVLAIFALISSALNAEGPLVFLMLGMSQGEPQAMWPYSEHHQPPPQNCHCLAANGDSPLPSDCLKHSGGCFTTPLPLFCPLVLSWLGILFSSFPTSLRLRLGNQAFHNSNIVFLWKPHVLAWDWGYIGLHL